MKDNIYEVIKNEMIAPGTFLLTIGGDDSEVTRPGQFINIKIDGLYLRRPMSICQYGGGTMTIIYKVVGKGTDAMSKMKPGSTFEALCPLGNGFDIADIPIGAYLIGGGAGAMPIYTLAEILRDRGKEPHVVIGFNTKEEIFFADEFRALSTKLTITTMDGSEGVRGTVVDGLRKARAIDEGVDEEMEENWAAEYVCVCGPDPMMRAVYEHSKDGQFDLGGRMACGFGACMGCTVITRSGPRRVCSDGPIFKQKEIIW